MYLQGVNYKLFVNPFLTHDKYYNYRFFFIKMSANSVGTYFEKKLLKRIKNLQQEITRFESVFTTPPFIVVYGISELCEDSPDWNQKIINFLSTLKVNPHWILKISQPDSNNPDNAIIELISHCVKERVYTILSQFIVSKNYDAIVIKDEI